MKHLPDKCITKRLLPVLLCLLLVGGCGISGASDKAATDAAELSEPELVEPVAALTSYVPAEIREISRVSVLQGVVCPDTTEYAYESSRLFGNYDALPGDTVHAGDVLFYGAEDSAGDEIEAIEEENLNLLEEYSAYAANMAIDIAKAKKAEFAAAEAYQKITARAPEEDSPGYAGWAKGAMPAEKNAKQTKLAREKLEQSLKERREKYELQVAYNDQRIQRLQAEIAAAGATAASDGIVVASAYHLPGDSIPEGTHILAVGDPDSLEIRCEYVSKSTVNRAEEIYALIDGKRFEVQYETMEPDEYRRVKQRDGDVYTTFHLAESENEVTPGQYAVIIIIEERHPNVLCVPRDAVSKDDRGSYVFIYQDGESIYTPVQTGAYDSTFIEITSGLKEGDPVVYDAPYSVGTKTVTLEKGEISTRFSTDGVLFYPSAQWLVNPAKTGTCYLTELNVKRYEAVEKGQVLARLDIVIDDIEVARIRRKIDRQNERLADLNRKRATTYGEDELESIDRSIRDRNLAITGLNRQLEKLTRYAGTYEITAPENGIITEVTTRKPGELIDNRERIIQFSRDDSCFIVVDDRESRLSYGDTAQISIKGIRFKDEDPFEGKVVTISPWGLTKQMRTDYALIRIPQENTDILAEITGSSLDNGFWSRSRFGIEATARHMGNVILIPKRDVYSGANGDTFVMTQAADKSVRLVKFIAGGSDNANYWVAYGDITEGMTICSE